MKHRWIGIAALTATLILGACAPTEPGTEEATGGPTTPATAAPEASTSSAPDSIDDGY